MLEVTPRWIDSDQLISNEFVAFTTQQVASSGIVSIYIHTNPGITQIDGGIYGKQAILAREIDSEFYGFLRHSLYLIDEQIELDFRYVTSSSAADVSFYLDSEIVLSSGQEALGIALMNGPETGRSHWEILLNDPAFLGNESYRRYAALHEIGHFLGLEHPFEDSDLDYFESNSPWLSAYPHETVMAYRSPINGIWPNWYSDADLAALRRIYGLENNNYDYVTGRLIG